MHRRRMITAVAALIGPDPDIEITVDAILADFPDVDPEAIAAAVIVSRGDAVPHHINERTSR